MSRTDGSNHKWPAVIAGLLMASGVLFLIYMITEQGEPGAVLSHSYSFEYRLAC